MSRIKVIAGDPDALAAQYRDRSHLAEEQPGCLGIEILRSHQPADEFVVYTRWEDLEAYERYRQSEAYREAHRRISDIPGGVKIDPKSRSIEIYDVLS